jgi:hypothetical protein
VEGGDAVAGFEFVDAGADGVDGARDVVARVEGFGEPFGDFPGGALVGVCVKCG